MAAAGAVLRLQHAARRQFARFGGIRPFQKYAPTKDWGNATETWAASGSPVNAACQWDMLRTRKVGEGGASNVTIEERVLLVEMLAFDGVGGLTGDWQFTDFDGEVRRLQKVVESDDGTYYVARFGGAG